MKPILLDIPEQFETSRLILRAPQFGDGKRVNEAIRDSFSTLHQWMNWAQHVPEVKETEENVRRARSRFLLREDLMFYVLDKFTDEFLGTCSLVRINWNVRCFEIGYWIRTSASGRGVMTEAVMGLTQFAANELNANRVEIWCDSENSGSRRVAERSGYHLEAILRKNFVDPVGQLKDDCVYAQIRLDDGRFGYPKID